MAQDIIKQIILQFKSSGSDQVKRTAESISKAMNPRDADRFLKSMEQLQSKFNRAGTTMSADMKKVTEYFKELNNQHFNKAERNLERMGRLMKTQIENIEKLKREGASADEIAKRESTLRNTAARVDELASQTPAPRLTGWKGALSNAAGGGTSTMALTGGAFNIAGAVATGLGQFFGQVNQYQTNSARNKIEVASQLKSDAMAMYAGDMSKAVLYSDPRRAQQINEDTAALTKSKGRSEALMSTGGILTGIAAILSAGAVGGAAGSIVPGLGTIIGAGVGMAGAAGALYSGFRGANYFMGGGKEAYKKQARELAQSNAAAGTMDMEYYNYLREKAPMRMQYQRQLQMGDEAALGFRQTMRSAGILDEGQMASIAGQFRQFGTKSAPALGQQAAVMARQMGQDATTTAQIMANIAGTNKGGAANAGGDFYKLFSEAVKAGIDDSALIEEYQKSTTSLMNIFKGRMDAAQASDIFGKYLTGTSDRDIKGAAAAMQSFGATVGGVSPLMQQKKTAAMLDLAGGDFLKFQMLNRVSNEQLANLSPDQMKELGIDPLKYNKFMKEQFEGTMMSATDRQSVQAIFKRSAGKTMSQEDQNALYSLFNPGKSPFDATPQERQSFLQRVMDVTGRKMDFQWETPTGTTTGKLTPKDEKTVSEKIKGTEGFAAKQVDVTGKGQTEIDIKSANQVAKDADRILAVFAKQSAEIGKQLDSGVLAKSVGDVSNAADQLATVMTEAAKKINTSWNLGVPQTSSKQPGE